jgi:hypothetical protein
MIHAIGLPKPVNTGPHTEPKICPVKQLESCREGGLDNRIFVDWSAHTHGEGDTIRRVLHFLVSICVCMRHLRRGTLQSWCECRGARRLE